MRILFLTPRFPYPPIGGDKLRIYNIIKFLSKNHGVSLLSFAESTDEVRKFDDERDRLISVKTVRLSRRQSYLRCLLGLFSRKPLQVHYYTSRRMERLVSQEVRSGEYDLIFVHLIRMAEYVQNLNDLPRVIDLADALSLNYSRAVRYRSKNLSYWISHIERERVRQYEAKVVTLFDQCFLASSVDKEYLGRFTDTGRVRILPGGVDTDYFQFYDGNYNENQVVFLGNMRTLANQDAAEYFCDQVLPQIHQALPSVRFTIVGQEPTKKVKRLAQQPNVEVTGYVRDVRPYLRGAAVSVCPMRIGAGMKHKILDSMAIGTPVLATRTGMEGIDAQPDEHLLVADSPQEFSENLLRLLKDAPLRQKIARNARQLVERKYTWDKVLNGLDVILEDCRKSERQGNVMT